MHIMHINLSVLTHYCFWISYQFLEDAYKNHKEHMEHMTHQLQEKKKLIEEVSDSINSGYVFHFSLKMSS